MRGITELNKYLKIFNQETGEYINLIGDATKVYPSLDGKIKINDFDNGAVGNVVEYTMQFSEFMIDQLDVRYTQGILLDYILETFYGYERERDETDAEYYARVKKLIFDPKISNLAIKKALEPYGEDIVILDGVGSMSAFTEVSYVENLNEFSLEGEDIVAPAFLEIQGGKPYFFRVLMSNLHPKYYKKVIEIIDEYKAGGVNYIIELREYYNEAVGFTETSFIEYDYNDMEVDPVITAGYTGT